MRRGVRCGGMRAARAAWTAGVLMALVAGASASPGRAPPEGWARDVEMSERASAATEAHYRAAARRARVEVDGYRAPGGAAVSLFITRVHEDLAAELPPGPEGVAMIERCSAIASEILGQIAATPAREQGQIAQASQRWVPAAKVLEGSIRWTSKDGALRIAARTVVAASGARIDSVTGECMLGADAPDGLDQACTAALDRLAVDLPAALRIPLAVQAGAPGTTSDRASELEILPDADLIQPPPPAGATDTTGARLTSGPGGVLMTMAPAPRAMDRRPVYFGLGVVVLAGVFWWNRQRRDRFEADGPAGGERGAGPRVRTAPRPGPPARPARDEDADDLAAAARGPAPQAPEDPT